MRLTGNSVLITGDATGIGFELARVLADRGNARRLTSSKTLSRDALFPFMNPR